MTEIMLHCQCVFSTESAETHNLLFVVKRDKLAKSNQILITMNKKQNIMNFYSQPVLLLCCRLLLFCHPQYFNHFFQPSRGSVYQRQGLCRVPLLQSHLLSECRGLMEPPHMWTQEAMYRFEGFFFP